MKVVLFDREMYYSIWIFQRIDSFRDFNINIIFLNGNAHFYYY